MGSLHVAGRAGGGTSPRTSASRVAPPLLLVLVTAAGLRLLGITFGLEAGLPPDSSLHMDEPFVLKPALRMVETGDLNPHWFRYPSLLMYVEAALVVGLRSLGSDAFLLAGRLFVAGAGVLTVLVVFLLGSRLHGRHAALAGALFLAVGLLHVRNSHYLTTDVPATAAAMLSVWLAVLGLEERRARLLVVAFALAGVAASFKYTAAACWLVPAGGVALLPVSWKRRALYLISGGLVAALLFFLGTPYALFDRAHFIEGLKLERYHYMGGQIGFDEPWGWLAQAEYLFRVGLSPPICVLAGAGLVLLCHRPRLVHAVYVFPLVCFAIVGSVRTTFARNVLPVVPFLCMAAGLAFDRLTRRWKLALRIAFVVAAASLALVTSVRWGLGAADSTRVRAARWMEQNLPAGSRVAVESFGPALGRSRSDILELWTLAEKPLSWYGEEGIDYIVASSGAWAPVLATPGRYADREERYRAIFALEKVAEFRGDGVDPVYGAISPTITIHAVRPEGAR
ncbi:MAG: glycosyltransferase family 39 protein [Planctomycetota bacterium]